MLMPNRYSQPKRLAVVLRLLYWLPLLFAPLTAWAKPNIIVIITDDQGFGDFGVMGNTVLDTPHLDAFAKQSTTFDRFYVSPVCTPTRASLMTGRYHQRTGAVDTWKGRSIMRAEEVTLAEALKGAGYATGIFGKWHLGDSYPFRAMDQGFEYSIVHKGGGLGQPSEPIENNRRYTDPILFRDGKKVQTKGYCTDVYFDEAIDYIEKQSQTGRPFFAYIATNAPHGPFHDVPEDLYEKYKAKDLSPILLGNEKTADTVARVFAMVENIDQNVGRLMAALKRLEQDNETLVLFMLDNGPNTMRYVGEMRGMKTNVYEGGVRSPLFVRWPGRFEAGHVVKQTAAHIDLMPTLLEAAGVELPRGVAIDGRSLLPLIEGKPGVDWPERSIVMQAHRGTSGEKFHHCMLIRGKWKLVRPSGFQNQTLDGEVPFELYDIHSDPREQNNLASEKPDVLADLKQAYLQWHEDVVPDDHIPVRIIVGTEHEPTSVLTRQDWFPTTGGGWGQNGEWMLHSERAYRGGATLLLRKPVTEDLPVRLIVGDQVLTGVFKEGTARLIIADVPFPEGDFEMTATIGEGDKAFGPWQIELTTE
ncbi:MAG: arylsulfatase [Planctomycetota bacterium]